MSQFHPLRVASVTSETRDAVVVAFDLAEQQREAFWFSPGQNLTLRASLDGQEIRRSYSICSTPSERQLRIAIKRVQDGLFSTWANRELKPGHVVECMQPSGSFGVPLDPERERHHVAFAAGSGITPILSILTSALEQEPKSRCTLVYGNRASSSVIFREELSNLKDRFLDRFQLLFILSREQQEIELFHGRIDRARCDQLMRQWIAPDGIDIAYLCGPRSMMEDVSASLQAAGVAKECIRTELFGAGASVPRVAQAKSTEPEAQTQVTVIQDGHQREYVLARNRLTLLEAALEQGIELPYSCKAGVCSTCRCKMTSGEVEMDVNFALEDYEVRRGFILTCQSYPLTGAIVLDFDQES